MIGHPVTTLVCLVGLWTKKLLYCNVRSLAFLAWSQSIWRKRIGLWREELLEILFFFLYWLYWVITATRQCKMCSRSFPNGDGVGKNHTPQCLWAVSMRCSADYLDERSRLFYFERMKITWGTRNRCFSTYSEQFFHLISLANFYNHQECVQAVGVHLSLPNPQPCTARLYMITKISKTHVLK